MATYPTGGVARRHLFPIQHIFLTYGARTALSKATAGAWKLSRVKIRILQVKNKAAGYRSAAVAIDLRQHPGEYEVAAHVGLAPWQDDSHRFGTCFDVADEASRAWLEKHGAAYKIHHPIAGDANHFEYIR